MSNAIFLPPIIGAILGACMGVHVSIKYIIHPEENTEGDEY